MEIVFILSLIFLVGLGILWLYTLIDALKSEFKDGTNKIVWLIVIFILGPIGSILYIFISKKISKRGQVWNDRPNKAKYNFHIFKYCRR